MVALAAVLYVPLLLGALAFLEPPGTLRVADWQRLGAGLAGAVALSAAVVAFSRWSTRRTRWGRRLFAEFHGVLAGLDSRHILALSLLSAFAEEALFRGALQPRLGLWWTAALFGLFHFPYRRGLAPWTGFALVLGVVLGALTAVSRSLWPAIVLHFAVNYFNIHDLVEHEPPQEAAP